MRKSLGGILNRALEEASRGLETGDQGNREAFGACYADYRQWVLVMTTGIAVRYLQGLPKDKMTDPAVVVLDEGCRFAISLLGGHEGGANHLAYRVANLTGAVPVITTATETLKPLVVGVGCRKTVSREKIGVAIQGALSKISRGLEEIREVATIDLKAQEPGLLEWCEENDVPLRIISRTLIEQRPWVTSASSWVQESIGVDGVCEPSALLATVSRQADSAENNMRWSRGGNRRRDFRIMNSPGKLYLVSVGPGFAELIPAIAQCALQESDVIVGYDLYLKWIQPWIDGKRNPYDAADKGTRARGESDRMRAGRACGEPCFERRHWRLCDGGPGSG